MTTGHAATKPLDDLICFGLYSASRRLTAAFRPALDELGLTYPQYLVLRVLESSGEITVRTLAAELQLDYGTLSPLLKRLESAGLVTRRRRPEDERSVLVGLTQEGRELWPRTDSVDACLEESVDLDEREKRELLSLLARVATPHTGDDASL